MTLYKQPQTLLEKFYGDLGRSAGQQLFEDLARRESLRPTLTPAKLLAFISAGLVHGLTLGLALLGLRWLLFGWPVIFHMVMGIICLMVAYALRPRFTPMPRGSLPRATCPRLYELADAVAQRLGVKPVEGIVLNRFYYAAFYMAGWRGRPILILGLPLLAALDGQELITVIGHELGHAANGDGARSRFVGSAVSALATLHNLLYPSYFIRYSSGRPSTGLANTAFRLINGPAMDLSNYLMAALSAIPRIGAYVLSLLLFRDSQRAEYLADRLGAEVGGNEAAISSLRKLNLAGATFLQTGLAFRGKQDVFSEIKRRLSDTGQLDQFEKGNPDADFRLDSTHPPTLLRIKMLRAHPIGGSPLVFPARFFELLDEELAPTRKRMQSEIEAAYVSLARL